MDRVKFSGGHITAYDHKGVHLFPIGAISTWGELLGMDNTLDVIDAIIHNGRVGEPEVNRTTGENPWTEVMSVKTRLERVRETEGWRQIKGRDGQDVFTASRAMGDFAGQRNGLRMLREAGEARHFECPKEWSNIQVKNDLDVLSGGECPVEESLLVKCQDTLRWNLGVPNPDRCPSISRGATMNCNLDCNTIQEDGQEAELEPWERQQFRDALADCEKHDDDCPDNCMEHCGDGCPVDHLSDRLDWITRRRSLLNHQLTGFTHDPFISDYARVGPAAPHPTDTSLIARKYAGR